MSDTGPDPALLCLVLSLADAGERRAQIGAALEAAGIGFDFVDGVDARGGLPAELEARVDRDGAETAIGRPLREGEIGCALGHLAAYRRLLESNARHALILEDDALPQPGLRAFLDGGGAGCAPLVMLHHTRARVYRGGRVEVMPGVVAHRLANAPFMATGYTIDRDAAAALIAAQSPVRGLADWPMDISRLGARAVLPLLVGHPPADPGQSSIAGSIPKRRHGLGRYLSTAHLARQWRKAISVRVS